MVCVSSTPLPSACSTSGEVTGFSTRTDGIDTHTRDARPVRLDGSGSRSLIAKTPVRIRYRSQTPPASGTLSALRTQRTRFESEWGFKTPASRGRQASFISSAARVRDPSAGTRAEPGGKAPRRLRGDRWFDSSSAHGEVGTLAGPPGSNPGTRRKRRCGSDSRPLLNGSDVHVGFAQRFAKPPDLVSREFDSPRFLERTSGQVGKATDCKPVNPSSILGSCSSPRVCREVQVGYGTCQPR